MSTECFMYAYIFVLFLSAVCRQIEEALRTQILPLLRLRQIFLSDKSAAQTWVSTCTLLVLSEAIVVQKRNPTCQ